MASAFRTKITKARFVYGPFSSEQMADLGKVTMDDVWARIRQGVNCLDAQAKSLKPGKDGRPGYPERKQKAGVAPVRNWISPRVWTRGRIKLMRALKVTAANENRAVISFIDPNVDRIAHLNNKIDKMFGLSPKNKENLKATVYSMFKRAGLVKVEKIA